MTKVRPNKVRGPLTAEDCVVRAAGMLGGFKAAAEVTGYEPSTVRAFSDPDKGKHIPLKSALELDLACLAEAGQTPFSDMMRATIEAVDFRGRTNITSALLDAMTSLGRLAETVRAAKCPDGPGGQTLTAAEMRQIKAIGAQLIGKAHEIVASVDAQSKTEAA